MDDVIIDEIPIDSLCRLLAPERARRLGEAMSRARARLGDRTVWHVNATARGGGVAEMLPTLTGYSRSAGIRNRWLVLDGEPDFFDVTKRIHNLLHGNLGDGGELGPDERAVYERVLADNLASMVPLIAAGDVVMLHDPQTAGLVEGLRAAGAKVIWRCHVGSDTVNRETDEAWTFLQPYIEQAEAVAFSRKEYCPEWVAGEQLFVMPPSIDPLSLKNRDLDGSMISEVLVRSGLVAGVRDRPDEPIPFDRRDGSSGTVRRHDRLLADSGGGSSPPPEQARLVVQVSRWDRLKDMAGVLVAFSRMAASDGFDDVHLMLVGPDVRGVTDDPEGAEVFESCVALATDQPPAVRGRIHLVALPMDDLDENALMVNAIQRHAYVIVQKSLAEGFGLTVTEAMWKARPVIASRVGGIQDQITHEHDGLLLDDPTDLDVLAASVRRPLLDHDLAERLGTAGRARVLDQFLDDRHLVQHAELFERVLAL
jgi:trehalose synthase